MQLLKGVQCWFNPEKMHQKRLAAGFRPDPLRELTALPHSGPLDEKGKGNGRDSLPHGYV